MESGILEALELMVVGMSAVFFVLLLVIGSSQVLISFVNRFVPEAPKATPAAAPSAQPISAKHRAIIDQAVSAFTQGKGVVVSVEKK